MKEVSDVIHAWTVPGVNPRYHYAQIARLKAEWPALYVVITRLVEKSKNAN